MGKKVLTKNAANQHEILEENLYITEDGYMETFVVNETSEDVWFDNFMVMSTTPPIVQETHYPDFRAGTPSLKSEKVLDQFLFIGQYHCFS